MSISAGIRAIFREIMRLHFLKTAITKFSGSSLNYSPLTLTWNVYYSRMRGDVLLKKTKIICTLGPASFSKQVIEKMFQAGMNGVRINTAYGNLAQYQSVIETVREVADIPIIIDIKGPEIRIRAVSTKGLQ